MTIMVAAGAALLLGVVAILAYRSGVRSVQVRWPAPLLHELRTHKLHCIGEQPEHVVLEIDLLCRADDPSGDAGGVPGRS